VPFEGTPFFLFRHRVGFPTLNGAMLIRITNQVPVAAAKYTAT
jgi:hypothetical protein